jgi:hypothetical protein
MAWTRDSSCVHGTSIMQARVIESAGEPERQTSNSWSAVVAAQTHLSAVYKVEGRPAPAKPARSADAVQVCLECRLPAIPLHWDVVVDH